MVTLLNYNANIADVEQANWLVWSTIRVTCMRSNEMVSQLALPMP